ncbi:Cas10/Cmr2 second palm domain-containing protein [Thermofilum pendens]|uniref:Cas10/Cmr2 second palm domain-containing protein n=1 Tax=Thermofilum pendens (strain DSM 2475 / Hrk 5) TaxID=368408 RepID=A1RZX8_THEPD|nr:hypothetical protein [Thermofilum pendens]ABL78758.1 hypothetical protein Tpen_1361 [Thermofilum pendens Hrk 5]
MRPGLILLYEAGLALSRHAKRAAEGREKWRCRELGSEKELADPKTAGAKLAEWFARRAGLRGDLQGTAEEALSLIERVDPLSAGAFSGVEEYAGRVREVWAGVSDPWDAPLLSPLRILEKMGYRELLSGSRAELDAEAPRRLLGDPEELKRYVGEAKGSRSWLAARPLPREFTEILEALKLRSFEEAVRGSDYGEVAEALLSMLGRAAEFYEALGSCNGVDDTLESVVSSTLALVPSHPLLPSVPLPALARLHAALASAGEGFVLLGLDVNGIQDFVYAPVRESAASRVLRGRSLLVELVQFTATRIVLELAGATWSAQLSKEGGAPTFVLPGSFRDKVDALREILGRWMARQFKGSLWLTVACSDPAPTANAANPGGAFVAVSESYSTAVAFSKDSRFSGFAAELAALGNEDVEDLDSLTREPVLKGDGLKLRVERSTRDYAESLAPDKLSDGDLLGGLTHISLACGSAARNLAAVVSLYFFKGGRPCREAAEAVLGAVFRERGRRLYFVLEGDQPLAVALAPFTEAGAIHVLVAHTRRELAKAEENLKAAETLLRVMKGYVKGAAGLAEKIHVEVRVVNAPRDFIPSAGVAEHYRGLPVAFSFAPYYTNPYHPVRAEEEARPIMGGERRVAEKVRLLDLDDMGVIAVSLLDADKMGDVSKSLGAYPAIFSAVSDFLSMGFGVKAYSAVLADAKKREGGRGILLYAAGDDLAVYGEWHDVLRILDIVRREVLEGLLNPLAASSGMAVADRKDPVLHVYDAARAAEREAKRRSQPGGSLAVSGICRKPIPMSGGELDLARLAAVVGAALGEEAGEFESLKPLVYALAELAHEAEEAEEALGKSPLRVARVVVHYRYLEARRGKDFEKLSELLGEHGVRLPGPKDPSNEVVRKLAALKPLFDFLALAARKPREASPQPKV